MVRINCEVDMAKWQVQKAKTHLSELIEEANRKGPQIITRHGSEHAVVLSITDYRALADRRENLKDYLLGGPKVDNFEIKRSRDTGRKIRL
jgi:antitoxin Phd